MKVSKDTVRNKLIFLGTAGARYVSFGFLRQAGGVWLNLSGVNVHVDPGPGAFVYLNKKGLSPDWLDAILITHRHLDHCADANHLIEAMTLGGKRKRGQLFCPSDALLKDPVILEFTRRNLSSVKLLSENFEAEIPPLKIGTLVKNIHGVETYSVFFENNLRVCFTSDTAYFDELSSACKGCDVLVVNLTLYRKVGNIPHLNVDDVIRLLKFSRPKIAILTHFGRTVLAKKPWEVASYIQKASSVRTLAAWDNMIFDLESLDVLKQR